MAIIFCQITLDIRSCVYLVCCLFINYKYSLEGDLLLSLLPVLLQLFHNDPERAHRCRYFCHWPAIAGRPSYLDFEDGEEVGEGRDKQS